VQVGAGNYNESLLYKLVVSSIIHEAKAFRSSHHQPKHHLNTTRWVLNDLASVGHSGTMWITNLQLDTDSALSTWESRTKMEAIQTFLACDHDHEGNHIQPGRKWCRHRALVRFHEQVPCLPLDWTVTRPSDVASMWAWSGERGAREKRAGSRDCRKKSRNR
jgi:hypothetical protein